MSTRTRQDVSRRASCDGKHRHATYADALREMSRRRGHRRNGIEIYRCTFCGGFHIGHHKRYVNERVKRERRRRLLEELEHGD